MLAPKVNFRKGNEGERTYSTTQIELMFTNYETPVLCFVLLAIRRTTASLPLYGLCTRECKHDSNDSNAMAEAVARVSDYLSIIPQAADLFLMYIMIAFIWYINYVEISLRMFKTLAETCARPYYEKGHNS